MKAPSWPSSEQRDWTFGGLVLKSCAELQRDATTPGGHVYADHVQDRNDRPRASGDFIEKSRQSRVAPSIE
jgi:hypothetical protein